MRIAQISIQNFKAVKYLRLIDLNDVILVAGPNGCGKSCIFDAIRLLKSFYGGYRGDKEWQSFFGEFQINMESIEDIHRLFNDKSQPIRISADFQFSDEEITFIRENCREIIYKSLWKKDVRGEYAIYFDANGAPANLRGIIQRIGDISDRMSASIIDTLNKKSQLASLEFSPNGVYLPTPNPLLEFVFSNYFPDAIGIIDYHGPNRNYQRERLGGINVNIEETSERMAQNALYNSQNKYNNIKTELASAYIRDLFIEKAGGAGSTTSSIIETLQLLFDQFLPGKSFPGPIPGKKGQLAFPVIIDDKSEHDIDDLSSGEKELVYGYLRLRNSAPSNSIILLDEPELHLNPRLVSGLPEFYRTHLGEALNNQLWMVTHSDAFLRDAFKSGKLSMFHMTPYKSLGERESQASPISALDEVDRAIVDMVGDLAGYRPGSKLVIFESSENAGFDANTTIRLFPEFGKQITAISADDKYSVRQLYTALIKAKKRAALPFNVYAIVDRDSEPVEAGLLGANVHTWDVYHIENYLLNVEAISKTMRDFPTYCTSLTDEQIEAALASCASETKEELIRHSLTTLADKHLKKCLDLGFDPKLDFLLGLSQALERVVARISQVQQKILSLNEITAIRNSFAGKLDAALKDGTWRQEFQGRSILKRFCGKYARGLPYEAFRDSILARMADSKYEPEGMKTIISAILSD